MSKAPGPFFKQLIHSTRPDQRTVYTPVFFKVSSPGAASISRTLGAGPPEYEVDRMVVLPDMTSLALASNAFSILV